MAMNNNHSFHLAAILFRNKSVVKVANNSDKTHPRFARRYKDNHEGHQLHAEMSVLLAARPGDNVFVFRFTKDGELSMAKPCEFCQKFLKQAGIKTVTYSDWDGNMIRYRV